MEVEAGYSYANIAGATDESYQGGGVGVTLPSGLNTQPTTELQL